MFKSIISEQYIRIVRYAEIALIILLIPLLYHFVPIDKKAAETLYIDAANIESIVTSLEKNGYTVTLIDRMMLQSEALPKSGWYTLDKHKEGRFSFYRHIYRHPTQTMNIVIFAGESYDELIDRLANDMKLDREKLYQKYKKLSRFKDADIFAGHYIVARKADEAAVMQYLFDQSNKILDLFIEKNFRKRPDHFELKVLLTIASIIQKESNSIDEMPLISSVIYNRLRKGMKLQMDATLNYGIYAHQIVTPERIKSDRSFYNTYKYKGLPPYPLGTVSLSALHAAMFPAKTEHLFFMLKPNGSHEFCATYDEHLKNIKRFRAYQKQREKEKKAKEALKAKKEALEKKKKIEKEKRKVVKRQKRASTLPEKNATEQNRTQKQKTEKSKK